MTCRVEIKSHRKIAILGEFVVETDDCKKSEEEEDTNNKDLNVNFRFVFIVDFRSACIFCLGSWSSLISVGNIDTRFIVFSFVTLKHSLSRIHTQNTFSSVVDLFINIFNVVSSRLFGLFEEKYEIKLKVERKMPKNRVKFSVLITELVKRQQK